MEYESTILKRLIETYGVVGNPRYISEIIKEFIIQGKECFPNLFTYQADWLAHIDEFGLNPSYTVSYTGQSIYAPNTLEKPVKSAILKGNTLSANPLSVVGHVSSTINDDNSVTMNADGAWHHVDYDSSNYVGNKATFVVLFSENTIGDDLSYFQSRGFNVENVVINTNSFKFYGTITGSFIRFGLHSSVQSGSVTFRVMLLDGDYSNHDVPYFEGIKSVKMPVLTTSGKNLMPINSIAPKKWSGNILNHKICDINLKANTSYTLSNKFDGVESNIRIRIYDENNTKVVEVWGNKYGTFTTNTNENYWVLAYHLGDENIINNIQIEEGEVKTAYEPYKSNILTVNEDVTLRSNGDVYDELNLLTARLTQRIDENNEVLSQEVIKTVDLNILDQNGQNVKQLMSFSGGTHINTGSLEGSPLPSVSVSVETDLKETLMVCSLDGNTI